MIQIKDVIEYLRANLPDNIRVDGAAALANAQDDSRLYAEKNQSTVITTLFVMYEGSDAVRIAQETFEQTYTETFSLIAVIDNQQDRTGKYAQQYVYHLKRLLFRLLLDYGKEPGHSFDDESHTVGFVSDKFMDMDRARYWHKFTFNISGRLTAVDGYQMADLSVFDKYIAEWGSNDLNADLPLATDDVEPLYNIPS